MNLTHSDRLLALALSLWLLGVAALGAYLAADDPVLLGASLTATVCCAFVTTRVDR